MDPSTPRTSTDRLRPDGAWRRHFVRSLRTADGDACHFSRHDLQIVVDFIPNDIWRRAQKAYHELTRKPYSMVFRFVFTLTALLIVGGVTGFGSTQSWATRLDIYDDDDPIARKGLRLQDGYYCGSKVLESSVLPRYGVIVTAKVVLDKNEIQFRLNGDVHLSWCTGNRFFYEEETSSLRITSAKCMEDILDKFALHSASAIVTEENTIKFKVGVPSWIRLVIDHVELTLKKCTANEAMGFIQSWVSAAEVDLQASKKKDL